MSFLASSLRQPHFTYTATSTLPQFSPTGVANVRPAYNELSVSDRVVRACAWTDKSADFVFGDGTVLSFCNEMQTFVAFSPHEATNSQPYSLKKHHTVEGEVNKNTNSINSDENQGDYFFTCFTLSKYENKVREALHIYNFYSPRPRIITGLTAMPCEVWRQNSPINSLVIAADARLFERCGSRAILWCAFRRISLTLHGGRMMFSVRWPAPAVERNMARSIFVRPVDEHGHVLGTLERVRAFNYTWVEQTFPVLEPPEEWAEMLKLALKLDREVSSNSKISQDKGVDEGEHSEEGAVALLYHTTPQTAQDVRQYRFSKMRREHIHSFIATSQMQNVTCNRQIRDPSERVLWRYDADPTGRVPHAIYWGLCSANLNEILGYCFAEGHSDTSGDGGQHALKCVSGTVIAMVREDESTVVAEPQGHNYIIHHCRSDGTYNQYHQSADGDLGLPPVIPPTLKGGKNNRGVGNGGGCRTLFSENGDSGSSTDMAGESYSDGVVDSKSACSPFYFSGILEEAPLSALYRGRYLPEVGASCIQISQLNLSALRAQQQSAVGDIPTVAGGVQVGCGASAVFAGVNAGGATPSAPALFNRTHMPTTMPNSHSAFATAEKNIVYMTSSIDSVGTFVALTNGTIRCHFDDRTLLFLVPGVDDREENLVATCIFRDATQCSVRLAKCLQHHPMYRYVTYALQFRRFLRISPEGLNDVVNETAKLELELLGKTEWRRENKTEFELNQLIARAESLLSGSKELCLVNQLLIYGEKGEPSVYFS